MADDKVGFIGLGAMGSGKQARNLWALPFTLSRIDTAKRELHAVSCGANAECFKAPLLAAEVEPVVLKDFSD